MFKILKVEVENFLNFKKNSFDLSGNRVFIHGKNGLGKTNILNAIAWVLTGKSVFDEKLNPRRIENFEYVDDENPSVKLTIQFGDTNLTLTRSVKGRKTEIIVQNNTNGKIEVPKVKEFEKWVNEELGFDVYLFHPALFFESSWSKQMEWLLDKTNVAIEYKLPDTPEFEKYGAKNAYDVKSLTKSLKELEELQAIKADHLNDLFQLTQLLEMQGVASELYTQRHAEYLELAEEIETLHKYINKAKFHKTIVDNASKVALETIKDILQNGDSGIEVSLYADNYGDKLNIGFDGKGFDNLSSGQKIAIAMKFREFFKPNIPLVIDEFGRFTGEIETDTQVIVTDASSSEKIEIVLGD